ncbi:helix-turn-helix transcriptional regulator [Candidatus Woesearchaeota archaeon]|nr:helix-turn-helix transcriptional regulator [Candidatus Woesearchaeota archaeon]
MARFFRRVTIVRVEKPSRFTINEEIQWFSNSLGLFGERDKEKSKFRIFLELLKAAKLKKGLSTEQLSEKTNLTRATIIHHLNLLMEQGLVIEKDGKYYLRLQTLEELVGALQQDIREIFGELYKIAESIDKELGLK